ncbi:MAG TPA: cellulase family glycosylhydrolase [Thermomicrobiaceae bacterium]|nr:cellulase family glycosylhydrolase [Thermomicrobiaceae bacterium]
MGDDADESTARGPRALLRHVRRLPGRTKLRLGLHLAVLLGLLASGGAAIFADGYFNQGVSTGASAQPIPHTDLNPLGINAFLNEEVDPARVQQSLDMIAAGGFTYVRQMFAWNEIEPAKNSYVDPATGASTWTKYDRIVDEAVARHLEIIARLDEPPAWARAGQPNLAQFPVGPPNDDADYARFVSTLVSRYRGKIHYIQIWNEPNLQGEWGGLPIDPARFTQLLKAAYIAAKQADPSTTVIMPGLAPTDQRGPTNLSDLLFLQGMYAAGAKPYFDIATVMVYGYGYSPYDRRVEFTRDNFSRPIQTHDIMVANGDAGKPVWAAEYGWVSLPSDWTGDPSPWGKPVTPQQQADYLYQGYLRARQEWPWMGVMCVWDFREPTSPTSTPDAARNPVRGFSIASYDFQPTPAYTLLSSAHATLNRAFTGAHAIDSPFLQRDANWLPQQDRPGEIVPRHVGASLSISFSGTGLDLLLSGPGDGFVVTVDGKPAPALALDARGRPVATTASGIVDRVTVADGLSDGPHVAEVQALGGNGASAAFDGFVVTRRSLSSWIYPWIFAALAVALVLDLASLGWALIESLPALQPVIGQPAYAHPRLRAVTDLRSARRPRRPGRPPEPRP